jgi:2-methylcitrate dehydratase PrpD
MPGRFPMSEALTQHYARLISESRPSGEAIAAARDGVLDFLAAAVGGLTDGAYLRLLNTLLPMAGTGPARLIGHSARTDAQTATLLNGYLGHALDYDDVQAGVRGHPSTVILPALFALAEAERVTAEALLAAYVVGVEAMARLGRAIGSRHYETGFHNTATLGPIGAAAALAHLLGFSTAQTANAIGIAATQAAGLRIQFASDIKPLHAGLAARAAILAVTLVRAGLQGNADALGGRLGFLSVLGFGQADAMRCVAGWGEPWEIVSPGLIFKAYPCCGATHLPLDALLALSAEHDLKADEVEEITATFPPGGEAALVVTHPKTGLDGRFSIEYAAAVALLDHALSIAVFSDTPIRADIAALLPRIRRQVDVNAPSLGEAPEKRFARVDILKRDGQRLSRTATTVQGAQDLAGKFRSASGRSLAAIPHLVATMQNAEDLVALLSALSRQN